MRTVVLFALLSTAFAVCPETATPLNNEKCLCPQHSRCESASLGSNACDVNVDDDFVFDPDVCKDCVCRKGDAESEYEYEYEYVTAYDGLALLPTCRPIPVAPLVHEVSTPTYGTVCYIGEPCNVEWQANDAVKKVTIALREEVLRAGQPPRLLKVSMGDIATEANNTGSFSWTTADVPEKSTYVVVLYDADDVLTIAVSPVFTIQAKPSGTCPAGSSSRDGAHPGCEPCAQGSYAGPGATRCTACPTGKTTPGLGATAEASCTLSTDSLQARFTQYPGRLIEAQDLTAYPSVKLERCAQLCILDAACKSFDFKVTAPARQVGDCALSGDTKASSLTHSFAFAEDGISHYERNDASPIVSTAFDKTAGAYVQDASLLAAKEMVSLETCAVLCVKQRTACLSFLYGTLVRTGECFLYGKTAEDAGAAFATGAAAALHLLDFYEKKTAEECEAGQTSATGAPPSCRACPKGSYASDDDRTSCILCPAGSITEGTGATSSAACQKLTCPAGSSGPDSQGDCLCPAGASCEGADCLCQGTDTECSNPSMGIRYFAAGSADATCKEPVRPPSVDFVFTPMSGDQLYYLRQYSITWQASNGVANVQLLLYRMAPDNPSLLYYVGLIAETTPNDGSYLWTVPIVAAREDQYAIVVFHVPGPGEQRAPTHRNTGFFSIGPLPTGPCKEGTYSESGEYPCTLCSLGTYWKNSTYCQPCPPMTTSVDLGSKTVADCNLNITSPLFNFAKTSRTYFAGSNAAGYFLEEADHKTVEECAQLCIDDAGCKSFDAGNPGLFQAGDCFLSYDSRETLRASDVRAIDQLDLYEKKEIEPILDRFFTQQEGCYIKENDQGGLYEGIYSPETCAQLCLNDLCCKSFDTGKFGTDKEYDCYISYLDAAEAADDFVCEEDPKKQQYNYFERKVQLVLEFRVQLASLPGGANREATIALAVSNAIRVVAAVSSTTSVTADEASGFVRAAVALQDSASQAALEAYVRNGNVTIIYPALIGEEYTAFFPDGAGPCLPGSVSQTGERDTGTGCTNCRANTYSNNAQTICVPCPDDTFAQPGSDGISDCRPRNAGTTDNPFNVGDDWYGDFSSPCPDDADKLCKGQLELEVVAVAGASIRLLATFSHGHFCDISKECRIESAGVSQFYLSGIASGDSLVASYIPGSAGWAGITDRSFTREALSGTITNTEAGVEFQGKYGEKGVFDVVRRCRVAKDGAPFNSGDRWVGAYTCGRVLVDGSKAREGEVDVRRMEITITSASSRGQIEALVNLDYLGGAGQYAVRGEFDGSSACQAVQFMPTADAWTTTHPSNVAALQLSGRLSAGGEMFDGLVSLPSACRCLGRSPTNDATRGASCDFWGEDDKWCYVGEGCAGASTQAKAPGFYRFACGPFPTCSNVELTRVCAAAATVCDHGYTSFGARCYKFIETAATFANAEAACGDEGGHLASLHAPREESFVRALASGASSAWLGLRREGSNGGAFEWTDGSFFAGAAEAIAYSNWTAGEPDGRPGSAAAEACAYLAPGGWEDGPCSANMTRSYVCKKPSLGVNASCACSGQTDKMGRGGSCSAWDVAAPNAPWCYASRNCPRAVPEGGDPDATLWRHYCAVAISSTEAPSGTPEPCEDGSYRRDDGTCAPCRTADACAPTQTLVGSCTADASPVCINCDPSCASCDGVGPDRCVTCASGRVRSADGSACLESCPAGQFPKAAAGGSGVDEVRCSSCNAACASCAESADRCTACPPGGRTFLREADGACVAAAECPASTFADGRTQSCVACGSCDSNTEYAQSPCSSTADVTCATLTTCPREVQYEFQAATATSDRICRALTPCRPGQFESAAPTATSDRGCTLCLAGTSDVAANNTCIPCGPGAFMPAGSVGACTLCPLGTFDGDSRADTPCENCPANTFADTRGALTCEDWATCGAGQQQAQAPSHLRDRLCVACPNGTFRAAGARPGTSCQAWTACPAGTEPAPGDTALPTATSDRQCRECQAGFYKVQVGNFGCAAASSCLPGTEENVKPTTTSDRLCRLCGAGSYSVAGLACVGLTACDNTRQYQSVSPTLSSDRKCTNLTICDTATHFVSVPARLDRDRGCKLLSTCGGDVYEERAPELNGALVPPQYITDRRCAPCSQCPEGQTPVEKCSATQDTVCKDCGGCGLDRYYVAPCTSVNPGRCADCDVCSDWEYEEAPCTRNSARLCTPVTNCTLDISYEQVPPTAISDRICAKVTQTCSTETVEKAAPTLTSDRVCGVCDAGLEFKKDGKCAKAQECAPGFEERAPPTATSDRRCRACPAGHFKASTGQEACTLGTECALGEVITAELTPTSDRMCRRCDSEAGEYSDTRPATECKLVSPCAAGQEIEMAATSQSDQKCRACPAGAFAAQVNQEECTLWNECTPGQGVSPGAPLPSASTDRVCEACVAGVNFTAQVDQPCKAVRNCPAGTEEASAPTASTDRTCRSCIPDFTFRPAGADESAPCKDVSLCKAGEREVTSPTASTDRDCEPCAAGTFRATPGIGPCQPHAPPCVAGTRESQSPSIFNDRKCEPCDPEAGEFQNNAGQLSCKSATVCRPGEHVTAPLISTQNRGCTPCPTGTYSDAENAAACTACQAGTTYQDLPGQVRCLTTRTCGIAQEVRTEPTATSDRVCTSCDGTTTFLAAAGCVAVTQCGPNTVTVAPPTPVSDRVCSCIEQQSFQSGSGPFDATRGCALVTRCSGSQEEFLAPTLRSDRICARPSDIGLQKLGFAVDFSATLPDGNAEDSFAAAMLAKIASLPALRSRGLHFKAALSEGSILAAVRLTDKTATQDLRNAAEGGEVAFMWPATGPSRQQYVAYPVGEANPDSNSSTDGGAGGSGDNTAVIIGVVAAVAIVAIAFIAFLAIRRRQPRAGRVDLPDLRKADAAGGGMNMSRASAYHNPLYDESTALHAGLTLGMDHVGAGSLGSMGDDDEGMYQDMGGDEEYAGGYADLGPVSGGAATGLYDNIRGSVNPTYDSQPARPGEASGYLDVAPPQARGVGAATTSHDADIDGEGKDEGEGEGGYMHVGDDTAV